MTAKAEIATDANGRKPVAILSHTTARAYYLTQDVECEKSARPSKATPLSRARASSDVLGRFNNAFTGFGGPSLNLIVPRRDLAYANERVVAHICGTELPAGALWRFNDSLYISSPELCFVQMASYLSEPQLTELGANLCGIYYQDPVNDRLPKRSPVTTPEKLARFVERAKGHYGVAKATRALRWVIANSRSPMETKLYILLVYPKSQGGYGLSFPELNYDVQPGRRESMVEQGWFVLDGCWPGKGVGFEYYGGDHDETIVADRRRLDALEALGWNMVVIDKQRLYDPEAFEVAVRQISTHLGIRIRKPANWEHKNLALRHDLGL